MSFQWPPRNSLQLLEYVVPAEAFSVQGQTLQLASGSVEVLEPTEWGSLAAKALVQLDRSNVSESLAPRCTLVLSDGVVSSQTDGLPSKPVEFGAFFFRLKDHPKRWHQKRQAFDNKKPAEIG